MDAAAHGTPSRCRQKHALYPREAVAEKLRQFEERDSPGTSCSRIAQEIEVPPRTLSHGILRNRALLRESSWPGAHHSPDLFHVQQDMVRATGAALATQTRSAQRELEKSRQKTADRQTEYAACREQCPHDPLVKELEQQVPQAEAEQTATAERVGVCQARQERARAARQGLGRDYHPVDLTTGQPISAEVVAQRLAGHLDALEQIAAEAQLSAHAKEKLAKARRVLGAMQATIAFVWTMILTRLEAWRLDEPVRQWMREQLIPGYYLSRVAK